LIPCPVDGLFPAYGAIFVYTFSPLMQLSGIRPVEKGLFPPDDPGRFRE
jgi:hypothetical protein